MTLKEYIKTISEVLYSNKKKLDHYSDKRCSKCNSLGKNIINIYSQKSDYFVDKNPMIQIKSREVVFLNEFSLHNYYKDFNHLSYCGVMLKDILIKDITSYNSIPNLMVYSCSASKGYSKIKSSRDILVADINCKNCDKQIASTIVYTKIAKSFNTRKLN